MIMRRILSISLLVLLPLPSFAALQCGPFYLQAKDDGLMRVNGVEPETQKIIFLKEKDDYANMKIQIMVLDKNLGRWLGMDYIRRDSKPILNVEVIRKNMDEPRRFWTYDCVKVK
ncbi:hypothetical protein Pcaca03_28530 [Pectobacterium carotovorum subsp. carotovorum]|uniref:Uncharacterized protein n=2 Tax=Pectobacterium carotovorum TaxID=554 RepID=A0AAI9L305_PECCC|nr:hypothetical protein SOASR016_27170 [Pectobacterium carotovorum subsp. carotovorum]GLV70409.1 hypothetical protein Pcaca03_28530 [Pectobacterium carotovorum subsp. carotovorum]